MKSEMPTSQRITGTPIELNTITSNYCRWQQSREHFITSIDMMQAIYSHRYFETANVDFVFVLIRIWPSFIVDTKLVVCPNYRNSLSAQCGRIKGNKEILYTESRAKTQQTWLLDNWGHRCWTLNFCTMKIVQKALNFLRGLDSFMNIHSRSK